ncbi:MAG TPA: uracil-DNA glycosylase family protein [Gemmatimonadaceae bacterium]|nr:uracil-DNA glycosylase family protein [Gemmatimonadaceae bacterium]
MDARERLRRYLEQRRDLGEAELVLDGMAVSEVMRLIGALGTGQATEEPASRAAAAGAQSDRRIEPVPAARPPLAEADRALDWREALRAAGNAPTTSPRVAEPRPSAADSEDDAMARGKSAKGRATDRQPAEKREPTATSAAATGDAPAGDAAERPNAPAGSPIPPEIARLASLDAVATMVEGCTRCPLYATATHAVPGEGDPNADFVCVGEAPGANEDATGRPFVGQAGQLLTKILAAINLTREQVFICNVLKHRPPGNRNPEASEVAACSPYLRRQLELLKPKVIVAFGTFAAQTLLDTKTPLGKLRGTVHEYHGIPLVVTYHPAALLRNPSWKRPTWEDVQLARGILDSARS